MATATQSISIGNKKIGPGHPVFIIAEAGVNHNGKLSLAKKLIDAAAKAGADAVKFQTFDPETLVTKSAEKAKDQKKNEENPSPSRTQALPLGKGELKTGETPLPPHTASAPLIRGETQYEMLKHLILPRAWHRMLKTHTERRGLIFLSTPFSLDDALFLKRLGVRAIKVGSTDTNNIPYLRAIARFGLPIILSTGMADIKEVRGAAQAVQNPSPRRLGTPFRKGRIRKAVPLVLLHCTTNYPTPFREANLRAIQTLQQEFNMPVGFSDHTIGKDAAIAAVALGAAVIEKHLTLYRTLPGPDHTASAEPEEFRDFVTSIRNMEIALGTGKKVPFRSERKLARVARKSVVALRDIKAGERFTEENLGIKRPGTGLPPRYYDTLIGRCARRDIPVDALLRFSDFE